MSRPSSLTFWFDELTTNSAIICLREEIDPSCERSNWY